MKTVVKPVSSNSRRKYSCINSRLITSSPTVAGREVENEDLVNVPNWLCLSFRVDGGPWFSLDNGDVLAYRQELDLRRGILLRTVRFRDREGRVTRVDERRIVHMAEPHLAALEVTVSPEGWTGRLEIRSALEGRVINAGVDRYRSLEQQHLEPVGTSVVDQDTVSIKVRTVQSEVTVAEAARTRVRRSGELVEAERRVVREPGCIALQVALDASRTRPVTIEKVVALYTSRDGAVSEAELQAREAVIGAPGFAELLEAQAMAWKHLWRRFDVELELAEPIEDDRADLILHLYLFHLLQTTSVNTMKMGLDVGVPSRGWHGEAYRGHIFWDELFIVPILNFRLPEITRALLLYRYRRLGAARIAAREAGYEGAMFPWQSGSDGREETQKVHLNPKSGRWNPDNSHLQRHVNAAIAYTIDQYFQVTGDTEFMSFYGAEMFLEIARFWASLAAFNPERGRYEIRGVMGPDEYHDAYPGAETPGLNNNAYTNVMAVWVLCRALEVLALLPAERRRELCELLGIDRDEIARWEEVSRKMFLPFHGEGILSQFEGYESLEELDWERYRRKHDDVIRLDRVLEAEGDTPNRYKASKQADVLMLFYLFSSEALKDLFERLGYPFEYETIPKNLAYYMQRSSHGSTLSKVVHSWVLARSDRERSWKFFTEALESDVADVQGGTTPEGIHLGAMAGTVDLIQRAYSGLETRGDVLWFNPCLPQEITHLQMLVRYRGHSLAVDITPSRLRLRCPECTAPPTQVGYKDEVRELRGGDTVEFGL